MAARTMGARGEGAREEGARAVTLTPPSPPSPSVSVAKDVPTLLADGDELGLGDVRLRVRLTQVRDDGAGENDER